MTDLSQPPLSAEPAANARPAKAKSEHPANHRATIVRWFTSGDNGEDKGQVLVVTQLKTGATCQIALIDALAVKNANEKARQIADAKAGSFDCAKEPEIIQPFRAF